MDRSRRLSLLMPPLLLLAVGAGWLVAADIWGVRLLVHWRSVNLAVACVLVGVALGTRVHLQLRLAWWMATASLVPFGSLELPLSIGVYSIVAGLSWFVGQRLSSVFHRHAAVAVTAATLAILARALVPIVVAWWLVPLLALVALVVGLSSPQTLRSAHILPSTRKGLLRQLGTLVALLFSLPFPVAHAYVADPALSPWQLLPAAAIVLVGTLDAFRRVSPDGAPLWSPRSLLRHLWFLAFLAAAAVQVFDADIQRRIGERARAEAAAGRSVDIADYARAPVTPADNAAMLLEDAAALLDDYLNRNQAGTGPPSTLYFIRPDQAREDPLLAREILLETKHVFDLIEDGLERPAYDYAAATEPGPPGTLQVPGLLHGRRLSYGLLTRAWLRASAGRSQEAADDVARVLELARRIEEGSSTLLEPVVAASIRGMVIEQELEMLLGLASLDARQLRKAVEPELRRVQPEASWHRAQLWDRATTLDFLESLQRGSEEIFARRKPWSDERVYSIVDSHSPEIHLWQLHALELRPVPLERIRAERRRIVLARIALAAAAHREVHGGWPDAAELRAAFDGSLPLDPVSGEPPSLEVEDEILHIRVPGEVRTLRVPY